MLKISRLERGTFGGYMKGLGILAAVIIVIVVVYGITMLVRRLVTQRSKQQNDELMRIMAGHAPELLAMNPLTPLVVQQSRLLGDADALFGYLLRNELEVFLPEEKQREIRAWQTKYVTSRK